MIGTLSTLLPTSSRIGGSADPCRNGSLLGSGGTPPAGRPPQGNPPGPPRHPPHQALFPRPAANRPTSSGPALPRRPRAPSETPSSLGDPELPRRRLQCPLVLVAYVQLLPDLNKSRSRI